MAIFHFDVKTFGRARGKEGSSSTSAAAYRSGERIHDHRTGRTHDHSNRRDVLYKEIVVPSRFSESDMGWAQHRSTLWNAAEAAEARGNARVAREYVVGLPVELSPQERIKLVRAFSQTLSDRYQNAVDIAIHAPRPESDPRNFHAHLLTTTREVSPDGVGLKTTLDISSTVRQMRGLNPVDNEYLWARERWATSTNEALREAGLAVRVDHRGFEERGVDRDSTPRIPAVAREIERRGERSFVADRIRADWQHQVEAKQLEKTSGKDSQLQIETAVVPRIDPEEVRRQARENWVRYREQQKAQALEMPNNHAREITLNLDRGESIAGRESDHDLAW